MPTPSVSSKEGNRLTWCGFEYASALLGPCALLVMDNLPALRSTAAREAIRPAGAELRFLPPYSPHLNPIGPPPSSRPTLKGDVKVLHVLPRGKRRVH